MFIPWLGADPEVMTLKEFKKLFYNFDIHHRSLSNGCYHFSKVSCSDRYGYGPKENNYMLVGPSFYESEVLSVNQRNGDWVFRLPYILYYGIIWNKCQRDR